jgi:hypothetical protein
LVEDIDPIHRREDDVGATVSIQIAGVQRHRVPILSVGRVREGRPERPVGQLGEHEQREVVGIAIDKGRAIQDIWAAVSCHIGDGDRLRPGAH